MSQVNVIGKEADGSTEEDHRWMAKSMGIDYDTYISYRQLNRNGRHYSKREIEAMNKRADKRRLNDDWEVKKNVW